MEGPIVNSFLAFIFSCLCIGAFKPISKKTGLTDTPCERKHHKGKVPLIGGVSIYCALIFVYWFNESNNSTTYFICITMLVAIGMLDDRNPVPIKYRLATQVSAALIMIYFGNIEYVSLGALFNSGEIILGNFSSIFTVVAVVGTINAFNMMDGIDGLCSGVTVIALLFLLYITSGNTNTTINITALIFCLLAYMLFNLQLLGNRFEKIFMGDAGSMLIGFSIAWLLIESTQTKNAPITPAVAIWIIALPLMDMGAVMIRRLLKGTSPLKADRNHLHHILLRSGLSSRKALLIMLLISTLLTSLGYYSFKAGASDWNLLLLWLVMFTLYSVAIIKDWKTSKVIRSFINPNQSNDQSS